MAYCSTLTCMRPRHISPETPTLGTVTAKTGKPGSVLNYYDYPVTATCVEHERLIRCDTYFGEWYHIDDGAAVVTDIAAGME